MQTGHSIGRAGPKRVRRDFMIASLARTFPPHFMTSSNQSNILWWKGERAMIAVWSGASETASRVNE
jgi:hypothetical protein